MKLALLNLLRVVMSFRHILPVFLFTFVSLNLKAQCPPTVSAIPSSSSQDVTPTSATICSGDSVQMVCSPSTGTTWQWYKDGILIPGATKSTYYGMDNAHYTVNVGGCLTSSLQYNIILKPLPVLSIIPSSTALCNGQQVSLFVNAGANVGWVWISPNSIFGTNTNPLTPNITTTTTFQVVGGSTITGCAKTDAVTIEVYPVLVPASIQSNAQVCPGETPPLITSTPATGSNGIYTYQWQSSTTSATTGFSNIPGAIFPTYQPGPTTQTTWYRLVTTSAPCGSENSNAVVVQMNPFPAVTSPPTKRICSGDNVNYHPTSNIGGVTFAWTASVTSGTVSGFSPSGNGNINDVLSLPAGSTTTGQVTYVITPIGPAPASCPGAPMNLIVTVNPIPLVTNSPLSQDICAGTFTTAINLQSNLANTTFTWTATATPGISGYLASGSGNIAARQIFSSLLTAGTIRYTITPHGPAPSNCDGPSVEYTINVNPSPSVTNNPMQQTICTGDKTTAVTLTSNVPSTSFTWTATAVPASVSGYQASGTSTLPAQTITNPSNVPGVVTYHIIPSGSLNGCAGVPSDYIVTVNPKPVASATPSVLTICSGETTDIALSSTVPGTIFNWTAKSPFAISGFSDGTGSEIIQTLSNISNAPHDVTYTVTPSIDGCIGDPIKVIVTVNPAMDLTVVPAAPVTCSGSNLDITLVGNISGIAFTWTATPVGNVTGYSDGTGSTISQTLINHDNVPRSVVYSVMMTLFGCVDGPTNFSVVVYPEPKITNTPLTATRCSGTTFNLAMTSNVAGTTYTWTANGTPGISGFSGGSGSTINQTLNNSTNTTGTVVYTLTPTANGCTGAPVDYVVTVNPVPNVNPDLANQSICSGTSTTPVNFSSSVAGTTYTWTASPSGAGITGYTASGSTFIQSQVISNSLTIQGTVTYVVTPSFNGCNGPGASHVVTVNPLPKVTNSPMSQIICSGATSANVNLLSNVAGTSFSWIATASSAAITGFQASGGNTIPPQTIYNSTSTPGNVTYQIIPTSNFGPSCQGTPASYTITVNPLPSITSSLSAELCSGQSFNYSISSNIPGTSFTWTRAAVAGISNSSASGSSASINETLFNTTNFDIDAQYILTPIGQAPTFCPGNPESLIVKVRALPQVNAGIDLTIPYGTYTTLNGTASGGTGTLNFSWTPNSYIGSGATTLTPQTINLNTTHSYTLSVIDAAGCTSNDQMTVFVAGSPLAIAPTAIPSTVCIGESSILNANASGGSGTYTYSWTSVPTGFTSTAENPNVSPTVNTTYTVTVSDGFNSVSAPVTVNVNPLPLKYVLTGGGSYCIGGAGVVVGLAGSESGVTYQLYNNGNPIGAAVLGNGAPMSFGNQTAAGSYTVYATRVSTGCTQDMGSNVAVSINPLPIADAGLDQIIPYGTNTTLFGTSSAGFGLINYSWEPSAFIASGVNTFSPTTTNLYSSITFTLSITDGNGCTGSDQMAVSLNGSAINIVAISGPDEICADSSQAQLTAIVAGGTGNYSYLWISDPAGSPAWTSTDQNPMVSPDVTTTYTVTANDGFNSAVASATILVDPLPLIYSITGGGQYCFAGAGASIGLSGSEPFTNYQLYRGGVPDGPAVTGTGSPISFGNRTASFTYTVLATKNITGCTSLMNGSTTITIVPPPSAYVVTGGGSYPFGGPGREIGLMQGDNGISYQLYYNNAPIGTPITGTGSSINFGYQTQAGTYTVVGTDPITGCTVDMLGSVDITILPLPVIYKVIGGGIICQGEPGLPVGLTGSESGIDYQLLLNGHPYGPLVAGTNSPLTWGPISISGLFEVRAINSSTGTTQMMNDSAVILVNPALTIFSMNPTGSQCPGTIIRLNGSETGIMYYMMLNGVIVDSLAGTGVVGFLEFGAQSTSGLYTINAVDTTTGCHAIMNGSTYINEAPQIFNVIPSGILCPGQVISLSGSEIGINYQLRWNGTFDLGTPVAGTGSAIVLGTANQPGIYSAIAINGTTNCVSYMSDSATLYPDPTAFTMVPDGPACEGEIIGLNGSEAGVDYVLLLDNAIHVDTISGTGLPISFGPQLTAGNYTIIAINQTSYCEFPMNGTTVMNDSPIKYTIQPAGIQCVGTTISLSGSQVGVSYQLLYEDVFTMGSPVPGTGGVITFGPQSLSGTYTVIAVNDLTGCNSIMSDSTELEPLPVAFTATPTGSYCAGSSIGLTGSEFNINYILVLDGVINIDTITGTGNAIDFGPQETAGTYSILAYNTGTFCSNPMYGSPIIKSAPAEYNITPAGANCSGNIIGLDNSELGVTYQLRRDGITNVGNPIPGTGAAISFGIINIPGTYTVIATNTLSGCAKIMNGSALLNPLPLIFAIAPQGMQCAGESISLNGSQIGTDYILVLDNAFLIDTLAGNGGVIDFGPQFVTGTYTIEALIASTSCKATMAGSIKIMALPVPFNITPAGLSCESAAVGLDGSEIGVSYTLYKNGIPTITIAGTGNALSFGIQTFGDYTVKAVNMSTNCSIFMPGNLQISRTAEVNTGSDVTNCFTQQVLLNGNVSYGTTTTWSTTGDGIFDDINKLDAVYTPGVIDIAAGKVNLLLSTFGTGSCSTTKVTDTLEVSIYPFATANAGADIDVCSANDLTINGATSVNAKTISWTSSGSGGFVNINTITPTYVPSANDLAVGSVTLTLLVTGNSPCNNTASDVMAMTFHPIATVNAGPDYEIIAGSNFTISLASATNQIGVSWSTSGTGTFTNGNTLTATYNPSIADYAAGSVVLTLTAFSNPPCNPVVDDMILTFSENPDVDFTWGATCEAQPTSFMIDTTVTKIGSVASWLWNFGDGNTSNQMNPIHTYPVNGDYTVTLTAIDLTGASKTVSHVVTAIQLPGSFFAYDNPNCSNEPLHFTDLAYTLYGYIAEWVWNYGDGSANDTIHFPDEPNVAHLYNVAGTFNVTLTVTNSFGCKSATTIPVEVIEAPVANFQHTQDCSGLETAFRDASYANGPGNTVQYWWDFGDPSTGTNNYSDLDNATHTFSAPGTYQVTHVVRNFNSCTDTIVKSVFILTPLPVDFVYGFICLDGITNFGPDTSVMNVEDITSWTWDFGDGVTNNQQYTTHVYAGPGTYDVKLTVTHVSGCVASKIHTVVVNPLPVAMFNVSQLPCTNAPVHFDDVSTTYAGFISKWIWDFGDGNIQEVSYPANPDTDHIYLTAGTYTVKLTIISSDSCKAERMETIEINPSPVANFDVSNTCQGTPVKFNDLTQTSGAGIINGWIWNFGDGASGINNSSSLQNPEHSYSATGTYQVSLTVFAANGCSSALVKTITISDTPFVDFSFDNHCAASAIQFTSATTIDKSTVSTWNWSFGDGITSVLPDPQHIYNTPGDYNVTLTIANIEGCENSISHPVSIRPVPVSKFSINTPACSQYKVAFTDQSSTPIGYIIRWEYNFGDGSGATINYPDNTNVSHTYNTYGTYTATLTVVTNDNCSATSSESVQVLPSPVANFDFNVSCLEVPVQFSDLSQGNLISWEWNFDDAGSLSNNTSNQQNPLHSYQQAGNYQVTLLVQNANGCHDTISRTISIAPKPAIDFSFNNGCAADTVHFNSSTHVDAVATSSWFWQFGDNTTSADADPHHIYANPGTYSVSLTITNLNGCTNVRTRQVLVTAAPVAMFTPAFLSCSGTPVLFSNHSSTPNGVITSWNWNFDDGNEVEEDELSNSDVTHNYTDAGIYYATLTIRTSTGCEASYTAAVTVNPAPVSAFSYASSCAEHPTTFMDQSQESGGNSIIGWNWNFGDPASGTSNISSLQNPQHQFSNTGTYNVTLTTENSTGCTTSVIQQLTISSGPSIDFTKTGACSNTPVLFNANPAVTNLEEIESYLWDFGDATATSDEDEPSHVYSYAGYYTVTLTITNTTGCKNSISRGVTIQASPTAQFAFSGNCASNVVKFADNSFGTGGEKIKAWTWDFGVSTSTTDISSIQNPSFEYSTAGTYNVALTVTGQSGCNATKVMPVTIQAAPEAKFSYIAEPCSNGSVQFNDQSISTQSIITAWYWEFAPGVYSNSKSPSYVFSDPGKCYDVKLIVTTSNGCTNTVIQEVCFPSGNKVAINYTQACFGETTWFSSSLISPADGSIKSYNWNFGDPATDYNNQSNLANPQHTFSKPGTYYVSLRAADINNCIATSYMSITVDPLPKADFSYNGGNCDSLVTFKDITSVSKIARWIWNFGDGKSKIVDAPSYPDVNHYYTYPGVYQVTLITQSEAGCNDTVTKTIRRTPCIAAAFKVSDPVVCQKRSMKFTETSTSQAPIASWQWFFGDNTSAIFTSPQQFIEHTYAVPGNYTVKMVVATQMVGGMVTDTASSQVSVKPAAKAAYKWQDVCVGNNTLFENETQNNNTTIESYSWNFGDPGSLSNTASTKQAEYRYNVYGEYEVKLVVTNTLGCTDTIVNKVNIFQSPAADFTWSNNCEAKPVYFADKSQATSSDIVKWDWRFSNADQILDGSTQRNCTFNFVHAGTYAADMMVTDRNGCSTTISREITIYPNPVAAFNIIENYENIQGQIMINNGSIDGIINEWTISNGKTSFGSNPVITFDKEGHYTIKLTTWNDQNCSDTITMSYNLLYKGLYVPNAFNPGNEDPEVAVFKPKGTNLKEYNIGIFDQWGNLLWSSNKIDSKGSPAESWDGTLHGKLLQQDVYVWKISAQFNDGEVWDGNNAGNNDNMPQKKSGTITMIR